MRRNSGWEWRPKLPFLRIIRELFFLGREWRLNSSEAKWAAYPSLRNWNRRERKPVTNHDCCRGNAVPIFSTQSDTCRALRLLSACLFPFADLLHFVIQQFVLHALWVQAVAAPCPLWLV